MVRINVLFVCSKNQWRSPTAEAIYRNDDRVSVRSRGTAKSAVQTIRPSDIVWADVVFVMEDKHRQRILADFPGEAKFKPVHVLDIPDDYQFMDDELVELIRLSVEPIIERLNRSSSRPDE
ncbi:Low molecular weight phosphotyrosine protein phosphatase [Rubripirellula amarantea]|uniref:Low molecular weight phosphotyrosine protein phosphatase n=1 Tax=Rubripirellula amarantea TaxID=2527999 RepID=A0A5C5WVP3_9BACT|nr:protein tyrosine phosphatase [Rubripirellula amarantea]TWT54797.1 Low molecular weight phosphotyrosine protein phosphatase [Rubripirellula amarantea]